MADVKGDLSGISQPGAASPKLRERLQLLGRPESAWEACPGRALGCVGRAGAPDSRDGLVDVLAKSAARSAGSAIARELSRGILGSLFGGSSSGRRRKR
jgi:hypothetical protein